MPVCCSVPLHIRSEIGIMTATALAQFNSKALATQAAVFGQTVRIAGVQKTAAFSSPRLDADLAESTVRVDRYTSIVRIAKSEVSSITTPEQWIDSAVTVELPEGASWRMYRIIGQVIDVRHRNEWRLEVQSV